MPRRKRSRKWLKWVLFLVLIVAAAVVWYFVWDEYFREKPVDDGGANDSTPEVIVDKQDEKSEVETDLTEEEKKDVAEKMEQYESEKTETEVNEYTGVLNYVAVNGDKLVVRVSIDQYVNGGTCTLSLRQNEKEVYREVANVADVVSTATCEGFDVPLAEIGASGKLDVVVNVNAVGKSGVISGKVEI